MFQKAKFELLNKKEKNMQNFLDIIKGLAVIIPTFSILVYVYQYYTSDYLIRFFYTKPTVRFVTKIFEVLFFFISVFVTIGCFFVLPYLFPNAIQSEYKSKSNFSDTEVYIILIMIVLGISLINLAIIDLIGRYSNKYNRLKRTPFYTLNKYIHISNLPKDTKIYLISDIDNNKFLIAYYYNNQLRRRIILKEKLENIPILTEEPAKFTDELQPINEYIQKSKKRMFFAYLVPILISGFFWYIGQKSWLFGIAIFIELQIFISPTTKFLLIKLFRKIFQKYFKHSVND